MRSRSKFRIAFAMVSLAVSPGMSAGTVTWTDALSNNKYNKAGNWDCGCIPNNAGGTTYDVTVPFGSGELDVNISPTLSSLTNGGTVNIENAFALTIFGSDPAVTNTVINTGTIGLNSSGRATSLILDSGGTAATFTLAGAGTIAMSNNPNNSILGGSGNEILINGVGQTIQGSGTIGNFASFTNNGTLTSSGTHPLIVSAPLTNWDGANLNGGTYNVYSNLQLDSIGSNATSATLNALRQNANVTINGPGILTGDGSTNALAALNGVTDSSLTFTTDAKITPQSGTLTISTDGLAEASLNLLGANLKVAGSLANNDAADSSTVMLSSGSALKVTGSYTQSTSGYYLTQASTVVDNSTLTIGGKFIQDVSSALTLSGGTVTANGVNNLGTINLMDSASVADFRTGAPGNSFANLKNGTLKGGIYDVAGTLYYDPSSSTGGAITTLRGAQISLSGTGQILYGGAQGSATGTQALLTLANIDSSTLSLTTATGLPVITPQGGTLTVHGIDSGAELLLDGTSLTVAGNLRNVSSFAKTGTPVVSSVTVQDGSTLTVTGSYTQSAGASTAISTGGSLFANGLANAGSISIDGTSTADFRTGTAGNSFANLKDGTLKGGNYTVAGTLYYDPSASGGAITTLKGANVSLLGSGEMLYGAGKGTQAFSTLANITDSNFMLTDATALSAVEPKGGTLSVSTDGAQSSSLTLNGTDLAIKGNLINTGLMFGASGSIDIQAGSALGIGGSFVQTSANTTIDASLVTAAKGFSQSQGSITTLRNGAGMAAPGLTNNDSSIFVLETSVADFRGGAFTNLSKGTLGGGGSYTVEGELLFDGGDIKHIASGTSLDLIGSGSLLTGAAESNALADLKSNAGTIQLDSGANLTAPGNFKNEGGTVTINAGSGMTADKNFQNVNDGIVSLNGPGASLTVMGFFNNAAGSLLQVGNTFDTDPVFTSHSFTNNGTLVVGQGSTASVVAFTNLTSNTLNGGAYAINGIFRYDGPGINVIGTGTDVSLDARGSGVQASILDGAGTDALASLDELAGTLALSGGQPETVAEGASDFMVDATGSLLIGAGYTGAYNGLGGSGFLTIDASLVNDGEVTLGSYAGAGSTLTLVDGMVDAEGGTYNQDPNASLILNIDNAFTDAAYSDQKGSVDLAGTLEVNPSADFTATLGEEFTILTFGSLTGNFTSLDFGVFDNNLTFEEIVDPNDIKLEVVLTPEPSTWFLLGAALLAAALEEWRRKTAATRIQ